MQRRVLHAAVIPIDRAPVFLRLLGDGRVFVVRVHIAEVIPAGACPLGHGIRLALGRAAAARTGCVDPVGHFRQGAFAVVGRLVAVHLREDDGQLLLGNRHPAALRAGDHRDRLAPVALTGEHPVAELVVDLSLPQPCSMAYCFMAGMASLTVMPLRKPELTMMPVSSLSVNAPLVISPPLTTSTMGRPNAVAKSQSRWSWPGTPMTMPVP